MSASVLTVIQLRLIDIQLLLVIALLGVILHLVLGTNNSGHLSHTR